MDSRERDQQPRQVGHILSSLIVRPSESAEGGGSDYEPGEVRRENPNPSSRSDRFPEKTQGYGMRTGSVSPFRQRKSDNHYGMHAGSVSPLRQRKERKVDQHYGMHAGSISLHQRNSDKRYGIRAGSISPMRRRNVNNQRVIRAGSVSPLRQRTVDNHSVIRTGSVSPFHQRNVDNHYGIRAGSISPLHQRNVDSHYGMHAGSVSPLRQRKVGHHYDSGFDHPIPASPRRGRGRGFGGGRGLRRFQRTSPSFGQGRGSRSFEKGFDRPGIGPSQVREEGGIRNNPNLSPREGDWICSDPSCGNLNFAWRASCNNCNRLRFGPRDGGRGGSPRGRHMGHRHPRGPWPRVPSPPMDREQERDMNGFDSPPRDWGRDGPRAFEMGPLPLRHGGRFPDNGIRRERPNYHEDDEFRGRGKLDRLMPPEWGHRGHQNGNFFHERRRCDGRDECRLPSPPPPLPYHDHWVNNGRERSRSPMRSRSKDYRRVPYRGRGRDNRRAMVEMRFETRY